MGHVHGHGGFDEGGGAGHGGGDVRLATPTVRRVLFGVLGAVAALTVGALLVLWPGEVEVRADSDFAVELVDATVTRVELVPCAGTTEADAQRCERITATVTSGPHTGERARFELFPSASTPRIDRGDEIVLSYAEDAPEDLAYQFADFQRGTPLLWLAVLFAVAVVALGRGKGVRALAGVGVSLGVIVVFLLPALLEGRSPLLVAVVASSAIAFLALFLTHGIGERTAVALLGTLASLGIAGALGVMFVSATRLTGLVGEEATLLQAAGGVLDFDGLLLAGILIGALGVLDDVTVTQVSAVWELKLADASFGPAELYRRAVRIGRDHIASVVNTLVLAYAGAALPLLLLFSQASRSFGDVVTGEAVAVEIVRTLVGSIGLVAAVPITTGLAALVIGRGAPASLDPESRAARRRRSRRDPFWDEIDLDGSLRED